MEDYNYRILLLQGYYQNELGIDFLIQKQKERNIEKKYFVNALRNAVVQWNGIINRDFSNSPNFKVENNCAISLLLHTNSIFTNQLYKSEIKLLWHFVQQLEDKLIPENIRYVVTDFYAEISQNIEFLNSKRIYNIYGYVPIVSNENRYKVYTPELATLLFTSKLEIALNNDVFDMPNNLIVYPIFEWFDIYKIAYKEGETFFCENFQIGPNGIYGNNSKEYIRNLHHQYYHANVDTQNNRGWKFVKNEYPEIITFEILKKYGYYAGVISKLGELIELHPALFKDFDKCEIQDKKGANKAISNFQQALKHLALVESGIEPAINGKAIVKKYGKKLIETYYNDLVSGRANENRKGFKNDFEYVLNELAAIPEAQNWLKNKYTIIE